MCAVVQLPRQPRRLCPDVSSLAPALQLSRNLRLKFTARAASDHLHDIARNQRSWKKYCIRGCSPSVLGTMRGSEGWAQLVTNDTLRARLVSLLLALSVDPLRCCCPSPQSSPRARTAAATRLLDTMPGAAIRLFDTVTAAAIRLFDTAAVTAAATRLFNTV